MADTEQAATLHFYQGAYGPTLLFQMYDQTQLEGLKTIFRRISEGDPAKISLRESGIVGTLDGVEDLLFILDPRDKDPSRMLRKVSEIANKCVFQFQRHKEGWLECSDLLDGLILPGHQYLSRGSSDEAVIIVSYQENLSMNQSPAKE
jgi:hypothetical protein